MARKHGCVCALAIHRGAIQTSTIVQVSLKRIFIMRPAFSQQRKSTHCAFNQYDIMVDKTQVLSNMQRTARVCHSASNGKIGANCNAHVSDKCAKQEVPRGDTGNCQNTNKHYIITQAAELSPLNIL